MKKKKTKIELVEKYLLKCRKPVTSRKIAYKFGVKNVSALIFQLRKKHIVKYVNGGYLMR